MSKHENDQFRLLITGGRDFTDADVIREAILDIETRPDLVIHGDSAGADRVAGGIAEELGLDIWKFPAKWHIYGRSAGMRRNSQMLREGRPTHVLAFPGGRGTENMVMQAAKAGIPVRRIADVPVAKPAMESPFKDVLNSPSA